MNSTITMEAQKRNWFPSIPRKKKRAKCLFNLFFVDLKREAKNSFKIIFLFIRRVKISSARWEKESTKNIHYLPKHHLSRWVFNTASSVYGSGIGKKKSTKKCFRKKKSCAESKLPARVRGEEVVKKKRNERHTDLS